MEILKSSNQIAFFAIAMLDYWTANCPERLPRRHTCFIFVGGMLSLCLNFKLTVQNLYGSFTLNLDLKQTQTHDIEDESRFFIGGFTKKVHVM